MLRIRSILVLAVILLLLHPSGIYSRDLSTIRRSGKIYVGFTSDDLGSINYDLAIELAKYLNVEMVPVLITWDEAFMKNGAIPSDLETNPAVMYNPDVFKKVDIICSSFTPLKWRMKIFDFAETLNSAELLMVAKDAPPVKTNEDLAGKLIAFMANTTFETHIRQINQSIGNKIQFAPEKANEDAKDKLKQGKVFGVILDADDALNFNAINGQRFRIAIPISPMSKLAWALEKGNSLQKEVKDFFITIESNDVLDKIFKKRFGLKYSEYVKTIDKVVFLVKHDHDLGEMIEEGELVIGLREQDFIYSRSGEKQFMQALAEDFADYLGISLKYYVTQGLNKYWETDKNTIVKDSTYTPDWFGYIDLACDVFSPAKWQEGKAAFIPVLSSEYTVVGKREKNITKPADLKGLKCAIAKGSGFEELLEKNKISDYYEVSDSVLINELISGRADYIVINDAGFSLQENRELESKFSLGKTDLCWAVRKNQPKLAEALRKYLALSAKEGLLGVLLKDPSQSPASAIRKYYMGIQKGQFPSVTYGAEDGLPQEDIYSILQDKAGYMWFGTCAGAVRYNGREMKIIGNSLELSDNTIRSIAQDSSSYIYLASQKGIEVVDKDSVIKLLFQGIDFNSVFIDSRNNKWFTGNNGICLLENNGKERQLNKEVTGLPLYVNNIAEDSKNNRIFFSSVDGIFEFSLSDNKVTKRSGEECYYIYIDQHKHLWISTKEGLFVGSLDELVNGKYFSTASNLNETLGLDNDIVNGIITGKGGSTWLIFDTKIIEMTANDHLAAIYDQKTGMKNNKILSAVFDREDNLWVGFFGGLQRMSITRGIRNFYYADINSYVYSFSESGDGSVWVASNNGIFCYDGTLINFSKKLDSHHEGVTGHNEKYVMGSLPGGNLIFACGEGLFEVNPITKSIIRNREFDQVLHSLESVFISSKGEIILLTGISNILYYIKNFNAPVITLNDRTTANISQMIEFNGRLLAGNYNGIVELKNGVLSEIGKIGCKVWSLCASDSILWAGTDYGLKEIISMNFENVQPVAVDGDIVIKSVIPANNKSYLWLGTNKGFAYFNTVERKTEFIIDSRDGLAGDEITPNGLFIDSNKLLWIGSYHGINNFNLRAVSSVVQPPVCFIEKVMMNGKRIDLKQGQVFRYNENNFVFQIAGISFVDEKSTEFEFYIRGTGNSYSSYNKGREYKAYYNNLPPGRYEFIYKAKGKNNIQSYAQKFEFSIKPAWFNTWLFRITVIILGMLLIWALYKARVRNIEAQKKKLEEQVKQRTMELQIANLEIQEQRDVARGQRDKIAEQNKEITDSIYYAERIQRSMLPPVITLASILPEHFVLFKPKNIVSGDFYWAFEKEERVFISAVDCTGHGVPGALMSMLGISFLNEIVIKSHNLYPDEVLNNLRESIIKSLKQTGHVGEARDGMDVSMISFDKDLRSITFTGANNPLYMIRDNQLSEIKGDKMPVGIYEKMTPFTRHTFEIKKGDTFYIFSDGYADQFGGPKSKKFMYANFKKLLLSLTDKPMLEQGKILDETIMSWQGSLEQVDDIVVIGIRF